MLSFPSGSALKAGLVRAGKAVAAIAIAGLITQVKPLCDLIPAQAGAILNTIGFPCAGVIGAALLGLEKTLTFKD